MKSIIEWPHYEEDEIAVVEEILRSGRVNQWTGEYVTKFESAYADALGMNYAVAVCNGTVALELAIMSLEIDRAKKILVQSRSFIATAASFLRCGYEIEFVDISPHDGNVDIAALREKLVSDDRGSFGAICVAHIGGIPARVSEVRNLCTKYGIYLIEDCAQAHGAIHKGQFAGTFGNVSAFSFCQDKIISTMGEGGLVVTDSPIIYERLWRLKDHGKSRELMRASTGAGFKYVHESVGGNYRLTEAQSAVGLIQLGKLSSWISARRSLIEELKSTTSSEGRYEILDSPDGDLNSVYKIYVRAVTSRHFTFNKKELIQDAINCGLPIVAGSCPEMYLEPLFGEKFKHLELPVARQFSQNVFAISVSHRTPINTIERVSDFLMSRPSC